MRPHREVTAHCQRLAELTDQWPGQFAYQIEGTRERMKDIVRSIVERITAKPKDPNSEIHNTINAINSSVDLINLQIKRLNMALEEQNESA